MIKGSPSSSPSQAHQKQKDTSRWLCSWRPPQRPSADGENRTTLAAFATASLSDFRAKYSFDLDIKKFLPSLPGPANAILLALACKSKVHKVSTVSKRGYAAYSRHIKESSDNSA